MANDRPYLINKHSNVYTDGAPKAPSVGTLQKGELAVNYNSTEPAIFLENTDGELEKFSPSRIIETKIGNKADDTAVVHNTGNEIINGNKEFNGNTTIHDGFIDIDNVQDFNGDTIAEKFASKQDVLIGDNEDPGQNIKTINGYNILGSGNIYIQGGSGGGDYFPGTGIDIDQASHVISVESTIVSGAALGATSIQEIVAGSGITVNNTTISVAPTIAGSTTVTSISSIPVTHRAVLATISTGGVLSFASLPGDGYEVHVIIRNSGSSTISITLPSSGSYICTSESTIYIAPNKYGEVNIVTIGTTGYVHGINSI